MSTDLANSFLTKQNWPELKDVAESLADPQRAYFLSAAYSGLRQVETAYAVLKEAIPKFPDDNALVLSLAYTCCRLQKWREYYEAFEVRLKVFDGLTKQFAQYPQERRWQGETDGRLCVICEQGIGDCIQYLRYLPLLKNAVHVLCAQTLSPLLEIQDYVDTVSIIGLPKRYDYWIPLLSIPAVLGLDNVPDILVKSPGECNYPDKPNVGIVWAGNPGFGGDKDRSCPLSAFAPIIGKGNIYSLQVDKRKRKYGDETVHDLADHPADWKINDLERMLKTWFDTACYVHSLDTVVSIDSAVLHLSAAMGKKTIGVLPYNSCWRWGYDSKTAWYPSLTLCRQPSPGDWRGCLESVSCIV